jgi:hypothetical protein
MFIPDPDFFSIGSRIQGQKDSGSRIRVSNKGILTPKMVSKLSVPGSGFRIRIPYRELEFLPIPDPGVKKALDTGSRSATLFGTPYGTLIGEGTRTLKYL